MFGAWASPMLVGDHIIQLCGPGERTFVVAIDRRDGSIAWQTPNEPGGSEAVKAVTWELGRRPFSFRE